MTRIRYTKNLESGIFESAPVLTGNGFTIATYNKETLNYKLLQYDTKTVIIEGTSKSLPELRKTLRKELTKLGANFSSEIRTRKPKNVLEMKVA